MSAGPSITSHRVYPGRPIGAFLRPSGFERLGAFGMGFAEVLRNFDVVYVAPARRTFEDGAATADQSSFPSRLVSELRRCGVTAESAELSSDILRGLAGCGAACFFDILPIAQDSLALIPGLANLDKAPLEHWQQNHCRRRSDVWGLQPEGQQHCGPRPPHARVGVRSRRHPHLPQMVCVKAVATLDQVH